MDQVFTFKDFFKKSVLVETRLRDDNTAFVNELSGVIGVRDVMLVSYNGDYAP